MPAPSDILRFLRGQILQTPTLPNTNFVGKVVAITGANTGLGYECAKHLVELDVSTIVLGCRDLSKGQAAKKSILTEVESIKKSITTTIHVWPIDMANFQSVRSFAARLTTDLPRLDALLANAGISTNEYQVAEGFESTLTVNVISTFLLSLLVLPKLQKTALENGEASHLSVVGSNVHCFADNSQLRHSTEATVFRTLSDKDNADMSARYFLSKLLVLQYVQELAKRIPASETFSGPTIITNCPSPGWCKTSLFRQDDGGFMGRNMLRLIGRTSEAGARTLTSAIAAGPETHGHYLSECQVKLASVFVRSQEGIRTQEKLWVELMEVLQDIDPGVSKVLG